MGTERKTKAISFTPEVLKAKLRALEQYGTAQTRRPIKPQPVSRPIVSAVDGSLWLDGGRVLSCPYGQPGDRLWIRERAKVLHAYPSLRTTDERAVHIQYVLDGKEAHVRWPKRLKDPVVGHCIPNGVHREGARHFLEVVEVRVERACEISEEDALLEGVHVVPVAGGVIAARESFFWLYDSIYGDGAHDRAWCFVYTLKRATP